MVKAICETYTQPEAASLFFADNVRGKGEGQIILLHGPPGTGKTLTAGKFLLTGYLWGLLIDLSNRVDR